MAKKLVLTNDSFPRTFAPHLSMSTTKDTTAARHPQGRAAIHRTLAPGPPKQEHTRRLKPPSSCSRAVESRGGDGHWLIGWRPAGPEVAAAIKPIHVPVGRDIEVDGD